MPSPGSGLLAPAHRQRLALAALVIVAVALVALAVIAIPHRTAIVAAISHGDVAALRSQLARLGPSAVLALVALVLAHTVLPFPAEIVAAAAGFTLGFALGAPLLVVSFLASAILAYLIGALAGRPAVIAMVGADRLHALERLLDRGGPQALLAVRLCPMVPFSPVGFACGLASVPLRRYVWTTALGMTPELAIVAYVGARLHSTHVTAPALLLPLAGAAALMILGFSALTRLRGAAEGDRGA